MAAPSPRTENLVTLVEPEVAWNHEFKILKIGAQKLKSLNDGGPEDVILCATRTFTHINTRTHAPAKIPTV